MGRDIECDFTFPYPPHCLDCAVEGKALWENKEVSCRVVLPVAAKKPNEDCPFRPGQKIEFLCLSGQSPPLRSEG